MLKIGEFSKLGQVSPKTLRLYDERGLLRPAWTDRFTGYRYYATEQLARLHRILALKDLGFSLEQIGELLDGDLDAPDLERVMRARQRELATQIAAEQARLLRVEARLQQLGDTAGMPRYEVVIKHVRPFTVAGLRQRLPSAQALPQLIAAVQRILHPAPDPSLSLLGIYYDEVFDERTLDVEVAAPVTAVPAGAPELVVHELPGAEIMACAVHHGPYTRLPQAYQAVLTWLDHNGYQAAGPNRDLFLRPPGEDAGKAVTEVQFPARPKPYLLAVAKPEDKPTMKPEIVTKPAFTVVGVPYFGRNENHAEIPRVWDTFNQRMGEIAHAAGPAYGLCTDPEPDGRFRYLAGFSVSTVDAVPAGMEEWTVPEQTYAVFPCTLDNLHDTYQYAFGTWLPQSNYTYTHGIDFELYGEEFDPETGKGTLYLYVPVEMN